MIYSSIEIQNFRCFEKLKVEGLKQFNLIVGRNNVGKTTFLETLYILAGTSGELVFRVDLFRGMPGIMINLSGTGATESPLSSFYYNFNSQNEIVLQASDNNHWNKVIIKASPPSTLLLPTSQEEGRMALTGELPKEIGELIYEGFTDKPFSSKIILKDNQVIFGNKIRPPSSQGIFLTNVIYNSREDANRLSGLVEQRKETEVVEALQIIEPRLKDLKIITRGPEILIYVDLEGQARLMPLALSGLGMIKILRLIVSMLSVPGGFVLIDEFEVGLHWEAMLPLWQIVEKIALKYDVQIFATTHSLECVNAAVDAFSGKQPFNLGVFRLEQTDKGIEVISYDETSVTSALKNDLEIR
jgi:AAA15 family ATPase/GTPase